MHLRDVFNPAATVICAAFLYNMDVLIRSDIKQTQTKVTMVKMDIQDIKSEVTTMKSELGIVQKDVTTVRSELAAVKSLFGCNGSVPFPHTSRPFPSVSQRWEGHFHSSIGCPTDRSHFCLRAPKGDVTRGCRWVIGQPGVGEVSADA